VTSVYPLRTERVPTSFWKGHGAGEWSGDAGETRVDQDGAEQSGEHGDEPEHAAAADADGRVVLDAERVEEERLVQCGPTGDPRSLAEPDGFTRCYVALD